MPPKRPESSEYIPENSQYSAACDKLGLGYYYHARVFAGEFYKATKGEKKIGKFADLFEEGGTKTIDAARKAIEKTANGKYFSVVFGLKALFKNLSEIVQGDDDELFLAIQEQYLGKKKLKPDKIPSSYAITKEKGGENIFATPTVGGEDKEQFKLSKETLRKGAAYTRLPLAESRLTALNAIADEQKIAEPKRGHIEDNSQVSASYDTLGKAYQTFARSFAKRFIEAAYENEEEEGKKLGKRAQLFSSDGKALAAATDTAIEMGVRGGKTGYQALRKLIQNLPEIVQGDDPLFGQIAEKYGKENPQPAEMPSSYVLTKEKDGERVFATPIVGGEEKEQFELSKKEKPLHNEASNRLRLAESQREILLAKIKEFREEVVQKETLDQSAARDGGGFEEISASGSGAEETLTAPIAPKKESPTMAPPPPVSMSRRKSSSRTKRKADQDTFPQKPAQKKSRSFGSDLGERAESQAPREYAIEGRLYNASSGQAEPEFIANSGDSSENLKDVSRRAVDALFNEFIDKISMDENGMSLAVTRIGTRITRRAGTSVHGDMEEHKHAAELIEKHKRATLLLEASESEQATKKLRSETPTSRIYQSDSDTLKQESESSSPASPSQSTDAASVPMQAGSIGSSHGLSGLAAGDLIKPIKTMEDIIEIAKRMGSLAADSMQPPPETVAEFYSWVNDNPDKVGGFLENSPAEKDINAFVVTEIANTLLSLDADGNASERTTPSEATCVHLHARAIKDFNDRRETVSDAASPDVWFSFWPPRSYVPRAPSPTAYEGHDEYSLCSDEESLVPTTAPSPASSIREDDASADLTETAPSPESSVMEDVEMADLTEKEVVGFSPPPALGDPLEAAGQRQQELFSFDEQIPDDDRSDQANISDWLSDLTDSLRTYPPMVMQLRMSDFSVLQNPAPDVSPASPTPTHHPTLPTARSPRLAATPSSSASSPGLAPMHLPFAPIPQLEDAESLLPFPEQLQAPSTGMLEEKSPSSPQATSWDYRQGGKVYDDSFPSTCLNASGISSPTLGYPERTPQVSGDGSDASYPSIDFHASGKSTPIPRSPIPRSPEWLPLRSRSASSASVRSCDFNFSSISSPIPQSSNSRSLDR